MIDSKKKENPAARRTGAVRSEARRPYQSPRLLELGDLRDVTLGGSPGIGDSGNPALFQP